MVIAIAIVFLGLTILYAGYKVAGSVDRFTEACNEEDVTNLRVGVIDYS